MVIVVGHTRYAAALELGMTEAPVHIADTLSSAQIKAYRIADNRTGAEAQWDMELLGLEIEDLKALDFNLDLTGFDADELAGIELEGEPETEGDTEPQTDRAEELREQWGVEEGQMWELGEHRLLCGDSTRADHVALLLGNDRPHLMVTDPPYGVEYDASWRQKAGINHNDKKMGKVLNDDRADWREAWALFPGEVAYVWHASLFTREVIESLEACDFKHRSMIIWAKDRFTLGRGDYHWQHEPCWYVVRNGKTGHYVGGRDQSTVWTIPARDDSGMGHSTQKPLECMERPIRNNSQPGDLVYEPFSGSGTTIIACENLKRRCRAIELSPGYVAVALQRWADHTGKTPTLIS
jgi:DNA modification methylase